MLKTVIESATYCSEYVNADITSCAVMKEGLIRFKPAAEPRLWPFFIMTVSIF